MSPALPVVSGAEAVQAFRQLGYEVARQRGSHIRLRNSTDPLRKALTVPNHRTLKRGLLRALIREAQITVDEFSALCGTS